MKKIIFLVFLASLCFMAFYTYAENIQKETAPNWQSTNYPVKNQYEKEYDADSNGFLEPSESKQLLKDKYEMMRTTGETGVDTDILQQYDADSNGSIDAREQQEIDSDIQ
jgi:hypothetical protein